MTGIRENVITPFEIESMNLKDLERNIRRVRDTLTDKQRRFVEKVSEGVEVGKSAEQAGYSAAKGKMILKLSATRTLRNEKVALYLGLLRERAARGAETTAEWVRSKLKEVIELAERADDRTNMINALDKLCKIDGRYAALKVEQKTVVKIETTDDLSEAELLAIAGLKHQIPDDARTH